MKAIRLYAIMLVGSLVLLTGCGKDDNTPDNTPTPPTPETPADSTQQDGTGIDDMHNWESDQGAY